MLILIVGRTQAQPFMLHLTSPAASKRHKGRIATDPLLTTRRFDAWRLGIATEATMCARNGLGFHTVGGHRVSLDGAGRLRQPAGGGERGIPHRIILCSGLIFRPTCTPLHGLGPQECTRAHGMSQCSNMQHRRAQWKHQATQRGDRARDQRTQHARIKAERDWVTTARKETHARLRPLEAQLQGRATVPKVDGVSLALHLFVGAHIGFRAGSRVLSLLAWVLGIKKAPGPHTILHWGIRLSSVRRQSARTLRGFPLSQAPFTHGLLWRIDSRLGLGTGTRVAVWACDAQHHQGAPGALSFQRVHGIGVCGAPTGAGDTIAAVLTRLIAQMGRPAASRKDGGSELQKAVALLEAQGRERPCIDDLAHAAAGILQRPSQPHPAFEAFLSVCGRVSGTLPHTMRAC